MLGSESSIVEIYVLETDVRLSLGFWRATTLLSEESTPKMLTLREVAACDGYYLNIETGDILRNIKPVPGQCDDDHWQAALQQQEPDRAQFLLLSQNVTASIEDMLSAAESYLGRFPSGRIINRQTAAQPNGMLITEVSTIQEPTY